MRSHFKMLLLCAFILSASSSSSALAGLPHLASWQKFSDDGQFVLVMISPLSVEDDAGHRAFDADEIRCLRSTYSQSGLYRTDGSPEPVWTISYISWTHEVFLLPDGKHLIFADQQWSRSRGHAVSFFSNGNVLAQHGSFELAPAHHRWTWRVLGGIDCESLELDAAQQTFTIRTNKAETCIFDVSTGQLIRRDSPYAKYSAYGLLLGMVTAALWSGYLIRKS